MKKIGLLGMVLVLCLAAVGAGYAMWSEELDINGTVNTGEVNAVLSCGICSDNEPTDKDVSEMTCSLSEDSQTLFVTVSNAYPCITYTCTDFDITNTGSIPVDVLSIVVDRGNLPSGATLDVTGLVAGTVDATQIHPGYSAFGTLSLHLDNTATETTQYTFSVTIVVAQYNEVPLPA